MVSFLKVSKATGAVSVYFLKFFSKAAGAAMVYFLNPRGAT